jgi:hypothetical protein
MYPYNVHVIGHCDYGYRMNGYNIHTDVTVFARDKKHAKQLASQEAKKQNSDFIFAKIKIKRKDIILVI